MADSEPVEVAPIAPAESAAAWPLSIEAGWNQTEDDWRFMLSQGRGFGCAAPGGGWRASSLVLPLGAGLAWISMVLVTRAARRRGLGTTLLRRCLAEVQAAGAVAGLDATEQGRPVYLPLGFRDLYPIARWHFDGTRSAAVGAPSGIRLRPVQAADVARLSAYDRPRSGMDRPAILGHLAARQPGLAWLAETPDGRLAGFVLGRDGRTATSLGPLVAEDEGIALALAAQAARLAAGPLIVDVPTAHRALTGWLEAADARSPRGYVRMTLGTAPGLDDPRRLFALAGPELG